ncbi:kinase-like protein [Daldinia caldariorum]|uniref:kinase-like protein n=1 Tax=Daldinia caldariorum TaxID=326644 RepID=UPI0020084BF4|nr:kinase-like protein [Daldinia caldariorum]KAI1465108.1 kinase-like protein [Daldinia caldariorum]
MIGSKSVLDNEKRVKHINDRGEAFSMTAGSAQHKQQSLIDKPSTHNVTETEINKLIKTIAKELDDAQIPSAMDYEKTYIPRHKLQIILTPEKIRAIVEHPCYKDFEDKEKLATQIYYGSKDSNSKPLLKLLAVFIGIREPEEFPKCIKEGMDDGCLPMVRKVVDRNYSLYCQRHEKHHTAIDQLDRSYCRKQFAQWSYSLIAPHIIGTKEIHSHYHLHAGDVFPMPGGRLHQKEPNGKDNGAEIQEACFAYGGFSEVYQVEIDEDHHDFGNIGIRHPDKMFALKKLTSHDRSSLDMELKSLLFCMDMSIDEDASRHMIQPLATFEVEDPTVNGLTYYILFDWAEGDLNKFWETNNNPRPARDHCKWMSHELYSLCLALKCVHNERQRALKHIDKSTLENNLLGKPHDTEDLYGRHGDIKPDNFLWFRSPQSSTSSGESSLAKIISQLALSDFGLGRLHTKVSRSNQDPKNISRTETYRAPEFDLMDGRISRASDIFSLGCVFLEYVTWFLLGNQSVTETFPNVRINKDIHQFDSDTFFNIFKGEHGERPILKESVKDWIIQLQIHKDCTWYLHQLLDIIRDKMLEPERDNRIHISELVKEMDLLRRTCEGDDSFYLEVKGEPRSG